jgi:hypothetical protein
MDRAHAIDREVVEDWRGRYEPGYTAREEQESGTARIQEYVDKTCR